jgi:hypothetical protein
MAGGYAKCLMDPDEIVLQLKPRPAVKVRLRNTIQRDAFVLLKLGFIGVWRANYGRFLLKYSDNIVFVRLHPCEQIVRRVGGAFQRPSCRR